MIEAVFQDHLAFLAIAVAITLGTGVVCFLLASRRIDRTRAVFYGLWSSSVIGPIILTSWNGSGFLTYHCTINPDIVQAFSTTQGQLNILLFAPFGLFAVLATRRPVFATLAGVLFTAAVETGQATLPFISRLCDTDDLITNSVGILSGAAIGVLVYRRANYGAPLAQTVVRRAAVAGTATAVLIAGVWAMAIKPVRAVIPSATPMATAQQVRALDAAVKEALGNGFPVNEADFHNNIGAPSTVTAPLPGGFAELTWPDREKLTVHFTPTGQSEGVHAYWIPGASQPVKSAQEAERVATLFAQRYAPWALRDSTVKAWPVDSSADLGWLVEWRRWRGRLLMPMRLDILIEPSGRMTDLIARRVEDPAVPAATVDENAAWKAFDQEHGVKPGQVKREQPVYLVERQGERWRVHWRLAGRRDGMLLSATVDATTGAIVSNSAVSESESPPAFQGGVPSP
ncbi:VanZ family protein [Streptomyces sp. NPDC051079]|uniref:VanZ family protein n=1 Tax=Streptomyces sp. NPDC051079 TaxID=3155043 RepID=UPI00344BDFAA